MRAHAARAVAEEWLHERWLPSAAAAGADRGLVGAFVMGSLAALDDEAAFDAASSDIDVALVVDPSVVPPDRVAYPHGKFELHQGCIVQANLVPEAALQGDALLTMLGFGCNLRHGRILFDPDGSLVRALARVLTDWHDPEWVTRRTDRALGFAEAAVSAVGAATGVLERLRALADATSQLAGLVPIASAVTPTHRRALALARPLLDRSGRHDLSSRLLDIVGGTEADEASVLEGIADAIEALEIEIRVAPPAASLTEDVRQVLADFVRSGIEEVMRGLPGDAMLPVLDAVGLSAAGATSATGADRRRLQVLVSAALERAGVPPQPWAERVTMVEDLFADLRTHCAAVAAG